MCVKVSDCRLLMSQETVDSLFTNFTKFNFFSKLPPLSFLLRVDICRSLFILGSYLNFKKCAFTFNWRLIFACRNSNWIIACPKKPNNNNPLLVIDKNGNLVIVPLRNINGNNKRKEDGHSIALEK